MRHWNRFVLSSSLVTSACVTPGPGMGGTESGTSSADGPSTSAPTSMGASSTTEQASADGESGDSTTTPIDPGTTGPTTGPDDTTTGPTTGTTGEGTTGEGTTGEGTTGEPVCPTVGPAGLPGVNPQTIWISNSAQSTISKIDTTTMTEEGRYITRPDSNGNPSRTSVSLDGDAAVANRSGGLTKYFGDTADCVDQNGDGVVTTSSGGLDVVPWDQEDCRAWHLPLNYTSQRPVAWSTGVLDEAACEHVGEQVWTAGVINHTTIEVLRVDYPEKAATP